MEVQAAEEIVYDAGPPAIAIDAVEGIACGLHRQSGDFWALATLGDSRDAGSDEETYGWEPGQFIHHGAYFLSVRSLGIENGLGVVEDYENIL